MSNTTTLVTAVVGAAVGAAVAFSLTKQSTLTSTAGLTSPLTTTSTSKYVGTVCELIDGKAIAKSVRAEIKAEIEKLVASDPQSTRPGLGVIIVGQRKDSQTYVRMKKRACAQVGVHSISVEMSAEASQDEIIQQVQKMNQNSLVHGILVQLPLPKGVDEEIVLAAIANEKDVDGFSAQNIGDLALRGHSPLALPCTPAGCMELLRRSKVEVSGKTCVVIGRSNIVGMPMSHLLQAMNGTVTVCHSRTVNIPEIVSKADIVIAAVGKANFVKGSWLKPGCVVIGVGINSVDDASKKRGYRLVGDVEFDSAKQVASKLTPVPGGVGPMTIAMLLTNTVNLYKAALKNVVNVHRQQIVRLRPVPSDIAISQSFVPLPIADIAKATGLLSEECLQYGSHKAKVSLSVLDRLQGSDNNGALVVVCGINPTPLGEGKSTTTIGLCQALGACLKKKVITTIRQPSQGPTFGIKGGAAGTFLFLLMI